MTGVLANRRVAISLLAAALLMPAAHAEGASKVRPKAFSSCSALGDYARKQAVRIVGAQGLPFRFGWDVAMPTGPPAPAMPETLGGSPQQDSAGDGVGREGTDFSGTNNQEEGVDEPDYVKTNGKHVYVATGSTVYVFDVQSDAPKQVGSIELKGYGHQLLLSGDRLLALTTYYDDPVLQPAPEAKGSSSVPSHYPYQEPATRLFEIDVSDPAAPKLLNTLTVEGFYTSARLRGSAARVVISTPPSPWTVDYGDEPPETEEEAAAAQRRAIRRLKVSTWVPDGVLRDRVRRTRRMQRMVTCDDVGRPAAYSGPGMLSVLTLDLDKGLEPVDSDSLMTDAQTIYASQKSLFVATERWFDPEEDAEVEPGRYTALHRFDISDPQTTEYRASGQVRGFVLNQFSLSEHEDALRVATTEEPPWRDGSEQRESESFVTVFDRGLHRTGQVGGLGKGERIYAVRFMGEKGYVVTFRQTDPLYTLDLSDPAGPAVRGELKILGFSSYLHPIGDDQLLGIGQDATAEGRTKGAQVSLFDVSDLANPTRLYARSLGEHASSQAEYDHHAFLYWPPTKLSVLPLSYYDEGKDEFFAGAVGLTIDRDAGISELGRIEHEEIDSYGYRHRPEISRSLVIRNQLLTVSYGGLLASTLDTLEPLGYSAFPQPTYQGCNPCVEGDAPPPPAESKPPSR